MTGSLETLIKPTGTRDFLLKYWGKEFLISKGEAGRFNDLFSWKILSGILSTNRFEYPRLRLLRAGRVIPPDQYIVQKVDRRGNAYLAHDAEAVSRIMNDGAMMHITSIGETWSPLARLAAAIEEVLQGRVQVNLHAGFVGSKGFHTHWDGHDVFAVQIQGKKKWRLFGITDEAPLAVPPEEKRNAPTQHVWEGVLDTGDMLYLPRGYWHATQFVDDASLHLTFAVQHPTAIDFTGWLLKRLADDAIGRRDIPAAIFDIPDIGEATKEEYISKVKSLVQRSFSTEALDTFLAEYRETLGRLNEIQLIPSGGSDHAND